MYRLKMEPLTRDIPVIFLTGQTEIEEETRGFEVGAVDYIHKPFSPAVVMARVQTHLVLRGIREQLTLQLQAIQKELETARQIQLSILPAEVPKLEGLDIAARYIPMTSVAGDFYDFIVVDENTRRDSGRRCIRTWNACRPHRIDDQDCIRGSGSACCRSGAGALRTESSPLRKVRAPFRHRGICVRGHGEGNPDVCGRRSPSDADLGRVIARCA